MGHFIAENLVADPDSKVFGKRTALLFAFLANRPGAREIDGDPAVAVDDLKAMFVEKRFPEGWRAWRKTRLDWVTNTTALVIAAGKEYRKLKRAR